MRILKMVIHLLALVSLALVAMTGDLVSALFLLAFGSLSLGIKIGEKNESKS